MSEYRFSERLFDTRLNERLTQDDVGEIIGVKGGAVSRYEKNTSKPNTLQLYQICAKLNVSADYMLGLDDRKMICVDDLDDEQIKVLENVIEQMKRGNE